VQVHVTDRTGAPAAGVQVTAEGPVSREGVTDASGQVQFRTMSSGTYRIRATHERFVTLEKEAAIRPGASVPPIEMALSAAAPPPAPPEPPPAPTPPPSATNVPAAKAGESRVVSIADLAERSLSGRDPVKTVPVACSGLDTTQMIVLRETLQTPAKADVDQMLYVVAGEAALSMGGRDQTITSGWYAMVPRGTALTLTKRGRNPAIVLVTTGGQPCDAR
jgi:mannose-6-phosphate isomerase-like protein (cupin superfamily)